MSDKVVFVTGVDVVPEIRERLCTPDCEAAV